MSFAPAPTKSAGAEDRLSWVQLQTYAEPILQRLDPVGYIPYRLYRSDTQYIDGKHVRDLSKLNRDLGKVMLITADPDAAGLQKGNAVMVSFCRKESASLASSLMLGVDSLKIGKSWRGKTGVRSCVRKSI